MEITAKKKKRGRPIGSAGKKFNEHLFQKKALQTKFSYSQYWLIEYSLFQQNRNESNFRSIIIARSSDFAKVILKRKCKEDSSDSDLLINKISMLHKNFKMNGRQLKVLDWMDIKNCAFPNDSMTLFKHNEN
jgi:hypothetical protein